MDGTKARATLRWLAALSSMIATIMWADQEGWSITTVASAINASLFAVLTGAIWADKLWKP